MSFLAELFAFMVERKRYWIWPIVIVMLSLSVLLLMTQGSAIAPFIYAIF